MPLKLAAMDSARDDGCDSCHRILEDGERFAVHHDGDDRFVFCLPCLRPITVDGLRAAAVFTEKVVDIYRWYCGDPLARSMNRKLLKLCGEYVDAEAARAKEETSG